VEEQAGGNLDNVSAAQGADIERIERLITDEPVPGDENSLADDAVENLVTGETVLSYSEEAEMAVDLFVEMATAYEVKVAALWPVSTRRKVAAALAAVLKKYNFSLLRSPEIALIVVAGPVLFKTSKMIAENINAAKDRGANG